jgi:hypothetical protein
MNHGMLCPNQLNHSFQTALIFKGQKNHSAGVWVDIEMAIPYLYKLQGTCKQDLQSTIPCMVALLLLHTQLG